MAVNTQAQKAKGSGRTGRGLISYESVSNRLRLIITAKRSASGKQERRALELENTPENRAKAKRVVDIINSRIEIYDDYKPCRLNDYLEEGLGRSHSKKASSKSEKDPQLDELWEDFSEFQKDIVQKTTHRFGYESAASNINKLNIKSLSDAKKIYNELRAQTTYDRFYRVLTLISACCDRAVRKGIIKENPFREYYQKAKRPNSDKEPLPFSRTAMERIIAAYKQHPDYYYFSDYVEFKFMTSCRPGEGLALKWKNVYLNENYIYFCESLTYDSGKW